MNEHVATRERLDSINLLCSLDLNSKYLEMPSLAAGDGKHNIPSYTAVCMSVSIINNCRISTGRDVHQSGANMPRKDDDC